jgi:hypothetical protein
MRGEREEGGREGGREGEREGGREGGGGRGRGDGREGGREGEGGGGGKGGREGESLFSSSAGNGHLPLAGVLDHIRDMMENSMSRDWAAMSYTHILLTHILLVSQHTLAFSLARWKGDAGWGREGGGGGGG